MRANNWNTAASSFDGPDEGELRWSIQTDWARGPIIVGDEGNLYLSTGNGLLSLWPNGEERWHIRTPEFHSVSVPTFAPEGQIVSTVTNAGLLFVTRAGGSTEVPGPAKFCSSTAVTIADDGTLYFGIRIAGANGQVIDGSFRCDSKGQVIDNNGPSNSQHPAITPAGHLLSKSETRFSFGGDPTECNDSFDAKTPEGDHVGHLSTAGHASAGDCWGSNQWGGNCQAICTSDGTPIVGVGRVLHIGDKVVELDGHGYLALTPDDLVISGCRVGLRAIDLDGNTVWTHEASGAHPVIDGRGRIYFIDFDGMVYCLDEAGKTVWSWKLPVDYYSGSGGPALSIALDGMLLVPDRETIYALG